MKVGFTVISGGMRCRDLMELPHRGFAVGGDVIYGHRARWDAWGGAPFAMPDFKKERTYLSTTAYALIASGLPAIDSEHRLITSLYGGIGARLDWFIAFRLPGRPTRFEREALSVPTLAEVRSVVG